MYRCVLATVFYTNKCILFPAVMPESTLFHACSRANAHSFMCFMFCVRFYNLLVH